MFLLKLRVFFKALWFHIYAGFPKASRDEIAARHAICVSCDKFNTQKSECSVCGCLISKKLKFLNKLAWADQECPIGKWHKLIK